MTDKEAAELEYDWGGDGSDLHKPVRDHAELIVHIIDGPAEPEQTLHGAFPLQSSPRGDPAVAQLSPRALALAALVRARAQEPSSTAVRPSIGKTDEGRRAADRSEGRLDA